MNAYDATEQAYKRGYEDAMKDLLLILDAISMGDKEDALIKLCNFLKKQIGTR